MIAKSAILITIADDFFDAKGSVEELEILTDAVGRYLIGGSPSCSEKQITFNFN